MIVWNSLAVLATRFGVYAGSVLLGHVGAVELEVVVVVVVVIEDLVVVVEDVVVAVVVEVLDDVVVVGEFVDVELLEGVVEEAVVEPLQSLLPPLTQHGGAEPATGTSNMAEAMPAAKRAAAAATAGTAVGRRRIV